MAANDGRKEQFTALTTLLSLLVIFFFSSSQYMFRYDKYLNGHCFWCEDKRSGGSNIPGSKRFGEEKVPKRKGSGGTRF